MKTINLIMTRLTTLVCRLTLHSFYSPLRFHRTPWQANTLTNA